jgi:predicted glutamine amidotransferase
MNRNPRRTTHLSLAAFWLLIALAGFSLSGSDAPPAHQCRFWGLIGSGYPSDLITAQLRDGDLMSLRTLGAGNPDGWGFVWYPPAETTTPLALPVARRGGPRADDPNDPDFLRAVDEIDRLQPRAALGHVRYATSGHYGIPDPHPFTRLRMSFAHNGGLNATALEALLAGYLPTHPLDYNRGIGDTRSIDSELYFVFLLKFAEEHPELSFAEALRRAVADLVVNHAEVTQGDPRLNFVMTDGDTLYALNYYSALPSIKYYPNLARSGGESPYWVVASEKLGSLAHINEWGTVPLRTLAVFVPDRMPVFLLIDSAPAAAPAPALAPPAEPAAEDPPAHNCRLWGLIGAGYPVSLIPSQLRDGIFENLKRLGATNDDGWGLGYFPPPSYPLPLEGPIVRRGGPSANNPYEPEYSLAVDEMTETAPVAAVGHVRAASSGHSGIPDPHPFLERGLLFAHNGGLITSALARRLGSAYLTAHPPDYTPGTPGTGYIDSELYLLYLLKLVDDHPALSLGGALPVALRTLVADREVTGPSPALNFVLTDGDTLYAFNDYGITPTNALRYYPGGGPSGFWAVASEPLGDSDENWGTVPASTLAIFVPGAAPRFVAIGEPGEPRFSLDAITVAPMADQDGDGWASALRVCCDPNAEWGSWTVSVELAASLDGSVWQDLVTTRSFTIDGAQPDEACLNAFVVPDTLGPSHWQLRLRLREEGSGAIVATATHDNQRVEGAARDTVPDLPRAFRLAWAGIAERVDLDADGFARSFTLRWDADLTAANDSALAYVTVAAMDGMTPVPLGRSAPFMIRGQSADTVSFPITVARARPASTWDLYLELYDANADTLAASAGPTELAGLAQIGVEGARWDEAEPPPPDTLGVWVETARPNPAPGDVRIPLRFHLPAETDVTFEVWDLSGRLIWREGPIARGARYEGEVRWRSVDSGVFFCRVRVGGAEFERRVVMVR